MLDRIRSNLEIVVYVLSSLGGASRKVSTEQIAYEAFKMAPDRFGWVLGEYQELPDKYVTKTALEDAAKKKYGSLVIGKYARDISKDGWTLTPEGVRWVESNYHRFEPRSSPVESQAPRLSPREVKRFQSRIFRERVFQIYQSHRSLEGITRYMFTDMLQCSPDAPPDLVKLKFNRLMNQALLANDTEIILFLNAQYFLFPMTVFPQIAARKNTLVLLKFCGDQINL